MKYVATVHFECNNPEFSNTDNWENVLVELLDGGDIKVTDTHVEEQPTEEPAQ